MPRKSRTEVVFNENEEALSQELSVAKSNVARLEGELALLRELRVAIAAGPKPPKQRKRAAPPVSNAQPIVTTPA